MDLVIIFGTLFDLLKLLIIASVVGFVLFKLFSPLRKWIEDKYSLSWSKSCLILNFATFFIFITLVFIYFMLVGYFNAPLRDPQIEYNFLENIVLVLIAMPRIIISSIILSFLFFFFELIASFFMGKEESKRKPRGWAKEFYGIMISSLLFVLLLLFIFSWVPLGLFIYIFLGSTKALPLIFLV